MGGGLFWGDVCNMQGIVSWRVLDLGRVLGVGGGSGGGSGVVHATERGGATAVGPRHRHSLLVSS